MENFLFLAETGTNAALILINLALVTALLLFVAWVYKRTHSALSYSQSSLYSILLMGTMATVIMMVITENIFGAFAFFIIFTLIRFRSIMKETRDAIFLLFALIIGVAVGHGSYIPAITVTAAVSLILFAFNRWGFYRRNIPETIFIVHSSATLSLDKTFSTRHSADLPNGTHKYVLGISDNSPGAAEQALDALERMAGVERVELMNEQEALEY